MDTAVGGEITFRLERFEGPLDLLLHLVVKNKVDIRDIPVAEILDQYLDYLSGMRRMDLEITSEFIVTAAELIYIKTRMLLPAPPDEEEEDPRARLAQALAEYRRFKEAAALLSRMGERGRDLLTHPPEKASDRPKEYHHRAIELSEALAAAADRARQKLPPPVSAFDGVVGREPVPVERKIAEVLRLLSGRGCLPFRSVFNGVKSRSEMVAVFLAVLELLGERRLWPEKTDDGGWMLKLRGEEAPCVGI